MVAPPLGFLGSNDVHSFTNENTQYSKAILGVLVREGSWQKVSAQRARLDGEADKHTKFVIPNS
jgi:hypothetical protein